MDGLEGAAAICCATSCYSPLHPSAPSHSLRAQPSCLHYCPIIACLPSSIIQCSIFISLPHTACLPGWGICNPHLPSFPASQPLMGLGHAFCLPTASYHLLLPPPHTGADSWTVLEEELAALTANTHTHSTLYYTHTCHHAPFPPTLCICCYLTPAAASLLYLLLPPWRTFLALTPHCPISPISSYPCVCVHPCMCLPFYAPYFLFSLPQYLLPSIPYTTTMPLLCLPMPGLL